MTSDPTTAATDDTSEPDSTPSESTSDSSTTSSSTSSTTSSTAPSTTAGPSTTLSIDQRAAINVKVLNGGANTGAAGDVTAAVRYAGFTAQGPADASPQVGATTVLYGPGQQGAATAVNAFVGALPANVVEGGPADANWARYGSTVDVLVVLGPGPAEPVTCTGPIRRRRALEPIDYVRALIRRWPIIVIGALIGAAFAFVGTDPKPEPVTSTYTAAHTVLASVSELSQQSLQGTTSFAQIPSSPRRARCPRRSLRNWTTTDHRRPSPRK